MAQGRTEPLGPLEYRPRFRPHLGSWGTDQGIQKLQWNAEEGTVDPSVLEVSWRIKDSIKVFLSQREWETSMTASFKIKRTLKTETLVLSSF